MLGIRVNFTFSWGFSVKVPKEAKAQSAYSIPPPTTLIGAVCKNLAHVKNVGETIMENKKLASAASKYSKMFRAAAAFYDTNEKMLGKYWEDPIRYQIAQFQRKERRGLPDYRFNIIPSGKIYFPNGRIVAGFLISEEVAEELLGESWETDLEQACYTITCLGSKESIVAVDDVIMMKDLQPFKSEFTTRFYQRATFLDKEEVVAVPSGFYSFSGIYVERFWDINYDWGVQPKQVEYVVPGLRDPVVSCVMRARPARDAVVYNVGEDGIAVPARSL